MDKQIWIRCSGFGCMKYCTCGWCWKGIFNDLGFEAGQRCVAISVDQWCEWATIWHNCPTIHRWCFWSVSNLSPFLLNATIDHHMKQFEWRICEEALVLYSWFTWCGRCIRILHQIKVVHGWRWFNLRKFTTNSPELQQRICSNEQTQCDTFKPPYEASVQPCTAKAPHSRINIGQAISARSTLEYRQWPIDFWHQ